MERVNPDVRPDVAPMVVRLIGASDSPFGWSVKIWTLNSGNYGYSLVKHDGPRGDTEFEFQYGGYDEPWNALRGAMGDMNEQRQSS